MSETAVRFGEDPAAWPDDAPMRLSEAVAIFGRVLPISVPMLRTEIKKGRLTPSEVAGKFFVTPAQLKELFKPCPAAPRVRASISSNAPAAIPSGSSVTASMSGPQAALSLALDRLRGSSPNTSQTSGRRNKARASGADVIRLKSVS